MRHADLIIRQCRRRDDPAQLVDIAVNNGRISQIGAGADYPFGRNNMLEVAFFTAHLLRMMSREEMQTLCDMITVHPAKAMNIRDFAIAVGAPANIVVLNRPDVGGALRFHGRPRAAISHGRAVDLRRMRELAFAGAD